MSNQLQEPVSTFKISGPSQPVSHGKRRSVKTAAEIAAAEKSEPREEPLPRKPPFDFDPSTLLGSAGKGKQASPDLVKAMQEVSAVQIEADKHGHGRAQAIWFKYQNDVGTGKTVTAPADTKAQLKLKFQTIRHTRRSRILQITKDRILGELPDLTGALITSLVGLTEQLRVDEEKLAETLGLPNPQADSPNVSAVKWLIRRIMDELEGLTLHKRAPARKGYLDSAFHLYES